MESLKAEKTNNPSDDTPTFSLQNFRLSELSPKAASLGCTLCRRTPEHRRSLSYLLWLLYF
jgi:hypothetical protein